MKKVFEARAVLGLDRQLAFRFVLCHTQVDLNYYEVVIPINFDSLETV